MRKILLGATIVFSSAAMAAPGRLDPNAARAAAVVDAFHAALNRGDTTGAALLLADDAVIFEEGSAELGKREYAAHHLPADAAYSASVKSVVTQRTGGGSSRTAWVASEGRSKGAYRGKSVDAVTTETMVLRRIASSWKIVHIHWSSREAKRAD